MLDRHLHDGQQDGLQPLRSLDLQQIDSFADLLQAMSHTAFAGRQLGLAYDVLCRMIADEGCAVVMTLSGAMTVAKQGKIICDLIDAGLVQAVISTGALMAHGLTESIGLAHYRYDSQMSDKDLFEKGYNRVYDTLELESNLNDVERLVSEVLRTCQPTGGVWWSAEFCRAVGRRLSERAEGPGILRSAFERQVPVFIPAFTDSEIGLDFATAAMRPLVEQAAAAGRSAGALTSADLHSAVPQFNPFLDLQEYARLAHGAPRLGILTIGGGVPRNWAQQIGPYAEIANFRLSTKLSVPRFHYGVRICPEPVHWGGLSGCTYSEGISWGKFVPPSEGGQFAEVHADATLVLPLLAKALLQQHAAR